MFFENAQNQMNKISPYPTSKIILFYLLALVVAANLVLLYNHNFSRIILTQIVRFLAIGSIAVIVCFVPALLTGIAVSKRRLQKGLSSYIKVAQLWGVYFFPWIILLIFVWGILQFALGNFNNKLIINGLLLALASTVLSAACSFIAAMCILPKKGSVFIDKGKERISLLLFSDSLIFIPIIALVIVFITPLYADYSERVHIAESLALVSNVKIAVTEYHAQTGNWPENNQKVKLPDSTMITSNAVKSVHIADHGTIVITYNRKVKDGGELLLVPTASKNAEGKTLISWTCSASKEPAKNIHVEFLPAGCRGQ